MEKYSYLIAILLFPWAVDCTGQNGNFSYDTYDLEAVYFLPPDVPNSWIRILADDGTTYLSGTSNTLTWNKNGQIKPAAYVSASTGEVGADFTMLCLENPNQEYYVRGQCSGGYELPIKLLQPMGQFLRYTKEKLSTYNNTSNTYSPQMFEANKVKYWQEFEIEWYFSTDPNLPRNEWRLIGDSKNPLYVTHKKPEEGVNPSDLNQVYPTQILHTSLSLSCKAANHLSDLNAITSAIYSQFESKCLKKVDTNGSEIGDCLGYWLDVASAVSCTSVASFLEVGDARCQQWALFFNDMNRLQGLTNLRLTTVDYQYIYTEPYKFDVFDDIADVFEGCIMIEPLVNPFTVLFVGDFSFITNTKFFLDDYKTASGESKLCNGQVITNLDQIGIPAQGGVENSNPFPWFLNHAIVKNISTGVYFDPSYGTSPAPSKQAYENMAFDGFGNETTIEYVNVKGGMVTKVFNYLHQINVSDVQQTVINP